MFPESQSAETEATAAAVGDRSIPLRPGPSEVVGKLDRRRSVEYSPNSRQSRNACDRLNGTPRADRVRIWLESPGWVFLRSRLHVSRTAIGADMGPALRAMQLRGCVVSASGGHPVPCSFDIPLWTVTIPTSLWTYPADFRLLSDRNPCVCRGSSAGGPAVSRRTASASIISEISPREVRDEW